MCQFRTGQRGITALSNATGTGWAAVPSPRHWACKGGRYALHPCRGKESLGEVHELSADKEFKLQRESYIPGSPQSETMKIANVN